MTLSDQPWVVTSFSEPNKSTTPQSTLIPGMIHFFFSASTNDSPLSSFWYSVSWNKITPEMCSANFLSPENNNYKNRRRWAVIIWSRLKDTGTYDMRGKMLQFSFLSDGFVSTIDLGISKNWEEKARYSWDRWEDF